MVELSRPRRRYTFFQAKPNQTHSQTFVIPVCHLCAMVDWTIQVDFILLELFVCSFVGWLRAQSKLSTQTLWLTTVGEWRTITRPGKAMIQTTKLTVIGNGKYLEPRYDRESKCTRFESVQAKSKPASVWRCHWMDQLMLNSGPIWWFACILSQCFLRHCATNINLYCVWFQVISIYFIINSSTHKTHSSIVSSSSSFFSNWILKSIFTVREWAQYIFYWQHAIAIYIIFCLLCAVVCQRASTSGEILLGAFCFPIGPGLLGTRESVAVESEEWNLNWPPPRIELYQVTPQRMDGQWLWSPLDQMLIHPSISILSILNQNNLTWFPLFLQTGWR